MKEKVFTDLMIDLETMGTNYDAAIMSIGAVVFDPFTGECGGTFHSKIKLDSCMELGLTVDASTIEWWLVQDKEAQQELLKSLPVDDENHGPGKDSIRTAIIDFGTWIEVMKEAGILSLERVWGNGAIFDIVVLENAMNKFKPFYSHILPPWDYNQHRDVRTLRDIAMVVGSEDFKYTIDFFGTKHDALADAQFQVKYVSAFWQYLNLQSSYH